MDRVGKASYESTAMRGSRMQVVERIQTTRENSASLATADYDPSWFTLVHATVKLFQPQ